MKYPGYATTTANQTEANSAVDIFIPNDAAVLVVDLTLSNDEDLDDCNVYAVAHDASSIAGFNNYHVIDTWTATDGVFTPPLLWATTNLAALAKGKDANFGMDVRGLSTVRITATTNASSSTLTLRWNMFQGR